MQPARDHGGEPGADLHRRALAPEGNAARQRGGATEELAQHRPEGDPSVMDEEGGLGLGNAAPARHWEVAVQQVPGDERAEGRDQDATPAAATGGYTCADSRPVSRMKATTTSPTRAPITRLKTSASWSSRRRRLSTWRTSRSNREDTAVRCFTLGPG